MIKFLKPIIEKNKITYPIIFKDELVKITNEYLTKENLEITDDIEGIIAAFTPIAICNNWQIISEMAIDELFYNNLMKLPNLFYKYNMAMLKKNGGKYSLTINAPTIKKPPKPSANRCATAMSGGIDCIYTLIKNQIEITDLFYVIGFDIDEYPSNKGWIKEVIDINKAIAQKFNKNLIVCRSNLLYYIKTLMRCGCFGAGWETYTVSGGISSIIYPLLKFNKLLISGDGMGIPTNIKKSEYIYGLFFDTYFNSNLMKIVHYDKVCRWEKLYSIAKLYPELLCNLRFCVKYNAKGGLNCGKCDKCFGTYAMMYLLGLQKYAIIKEINDDNYLTVLNNFIERTGQSVFTIQIKHLLKNYDANTKTTKLK